MVHCKKVQAWKLEISHNDDNLRIRTATPLFGDSVIEMTCTERKANAWRWRVKKKE